MTGAERNKITHPLDSDLPRNRKSRVLWFVGTMITIFTFFTNLGLQVGQELFTGTMTTISTTVGAGIGVMLSYIAAEAFFFIRNNTTGMFLTQDMWRSVRGLDDVNVPYGPGFHIKYFWELRLAENNISLEEAADDFEFEVMCIDGVLRVFGSFRMRPDMFRATDFLSGVAAVADDMQARIVAKILQRFSGKTVTEALSELKELNKELEELTGTPGGENHPIEESFGVQISDVTVSKLLPSEEVIRTISSQAEATSIRKTMLTTLGVKSESAFTRKRNQGLITDEDVERARYAAMSMSGNLEGVTVERKEYVVSLNGVDPDAVKAIAEAAPAIAAMVGRKDKKSSGGKKPRQKSQKGDK